MHPPRLTVVGNCQAESTRKLLMSTGQFTSERITPVHELTAADLSWFTDLLGRTDVLVTQPIRDDYRGLPVGTSQLVRALPRSARHVVVPVLRFDGLMPYQAIIRNPLDTSENPPVVPYHDLRTLVAAARGAEHPSTVAPSAEALRRAAEMSIAHMRARERAYSTVVVSDFLETMPLWHTVNHPDNATLAHLARQVLAALQVPGDPVLPEYEMLGQLDAPVDPAAARALGRADDPSLQARQLWRDRTTGVIDGAEIARAHLEYYSARPELVRHGLARHAERITNLGLDQEVAA